MLVERTARIATKDMLETQRQEVVLQLIHKNPRDVCVMLWEVLMKHISTVSITTIM